MHIITLVTIVNRASNLFLMDCALACLHGNVPRMIKPPVKLIRYVDSFQLGVDAARSLNIPHPNLCHIMAGHRRVPANRVLQWATIIGCAPEDLRPDMAAKGK